MAVIDGLKVTLEDRWRSAQRNDLRGWYTADGGRALDSMKEDGSAFPVIYKDEHHGWHIKIFNGDQWQQAKDFADRTQSDFDGLKYDGKRKTIEQYKADIEKARPQIEAHVNEVNRRIGHDRGGGPER